jgi:2-polyprenyl-3-methyl-5-hydroxy-6-metoxy-1,4-benzoquinol methylase
VKYRWQIFAKRLEEIRRSHAKPRALDFGAGSLRDSYELAKLDFDVTSVDLDQSLLQSYARSYDWSQVKSRPQLFDGSLEELTNRNNGERFNLAIAFDVIEHLEDPADYCRKISSLLGERGMLFTIVPNRRSLFERYFKHTIRKQRAKGIAFKPGVPHLQFKTPTEWEQLFEANGFKIIDHQMAIGFFVNDCWNGLMGLPLRVFVVPVLTRLSQLLPLDFDPVGFEERFSPKWLMKYVDVLDNWTRSVFSQRFGWNLIVAERVNS